MSGVHEGGEMSMKTPMKIDVHQHVQPPFWVEHLRQEKPGYRLPDWSPEVAMASMDAQGIAKGMLSLTDPGLSSWPSGEHRNVARKVNEYTAELGAKWPTRFGNLATLPLPDVDGAVREAAYALDTPGADGVLVFSHYGDQYLGDPLFEPLWDELDRRAAVVLIHPTATALPDLDGIPAPVVDFPFATTRTAVDIVLKGVLDRHQNVRVILSHAGGFLPYTAYRIAMGGSKRPGSPSIDALMDTFRRFYLDTAVSSSPTTIPSLKAFADPAHIVFGSDYPYAVGMSAEVTATLDTTPLLSEAERAAISHLNARTLFSDRTVRPS